jgi:hypothetical protein
MIRILWQREMRKAKRNIKGLLEMKIQGLIELCSSRCSTRINEKEKG